MDNAGLFPSLSLSVSELTSLIKKTLAGGFYDLNVEGEISNFRPSSSGHWYFTLKDADAMLSAVMFRGKASMLDFFPRDGEMVVVTGAIDVYEKRGTYQIICSSMTRVGEGNLQARLEQLKNHYASLGYFDPASKKSIPPDPQRVAVVTSESGAALHDILQVLGRRAAGLDVVILPTRVQGDEAAASIATRIRQADRFLLGDVIIVARGGGSLEDLMPFSDPSVIEAIHDCALPVISAVGHEIDWMLSDYVADIRAPTPSAAAELVSASRSERLEKLRAVRSTLVHLIQNRLSEARMLLSQASPRTLSERLVSRIEQNRYLLDDMDMRMKETLLHRFEQARRTLASHTAQLQALSPQSILERGYAVITDTMTGQNMTSATQLAGEKDITIHLHDGSVAATTRRTK
ncbi:exodeoxyribonuclease VII large subunit [Parasphaerochaeta coccoides]|uniref:Exodeoxyribonuclease 7 large subunit n=1 Tax=Parasphaerochaeta coccoides (strain ATCC BAA-1237 / DSM 17374 / SPN1) TaxID=760011 RepID=F4GHA9_PARC1|nr:exodeoxyribonuclease VII large subunit [Parasphaerochaeta coccoides]AEC02008.1 Exodeoxyribonuclease 7 large subunit [Parasphaerochaeta coccoides DSM 17374]